jgi:hypothetical protein
MDVAVILLIALGISMGVYMLYRQLFLKVPKTIHSKKSHFTLKIETE